MSSTRNTILHPQFTQEKWVPKLTEVLNRELEKDTEAPVCIFRVPNSLRDHKPEAYTPQLIALGPYYHLNSELYEKQSYKIVSAKMFSKQYYVVDFKKLVDQLMTIILKIRHYDRGRFSLRNNTLAMIFIVDGLFMLHLFDNYVKLQENPSTSSLLADSSSRRNYLGMPSSETF